ncbi:MAG TPA: ABC transporter permease [Firmicutes bacterium]|jgi:multiple sugar transport system permease protein|nr:ABC transporter permease [Bacillota bacterium]
MARTEMLPENQMWRYRLSHFTKRFFLYAVLIAGALIMIAPFVWMLSSSLKAPHEISLKYIKWLPETPQWQNYKIAWEAAPFSTYFRNSFFIAAVCMLIEVVFSSLAAYAFAKMNFFGKNVLFVLFLGTMMIPGEVMLIPNYITMVNFGWIDTYYALIIPWTVSVFSIFLLRQFFMSIPHELFEAALLDGCGKFKYLITVMLPLSKPALATVMLFKFIGSWNAFLWVLIMTNTPSMRTIPVGLTYFVSDVGAQYNYLMAASTFAMAPILILFLLLQKQFIQGIARTGLKG